MSAMKSDRTPANERDFKGVFIPKEIWCHPDLSGDEKMMWGEIYALDNEFGCIASNEHFMEMFGWSNPRKVQREIKSLKDKDLISVEQNKISDTRTMRVSGKYRHLDQTHMEDLMALKAELVNRMGKH